MPPSDSRDRIDKLLDESKPKKDDPTPRSSLSKRGARQRGSPIEAPLPAGQIPLKCGQ
jgi:hypothetical protein